MAIDWSVTSTPSVAMTRTSGDAVRSGRMMSRCVSAPIVADTATPTKAAGRNAQSWLTASSHST